jgi:hypothetical protein
MTDSNVHVVRVSLDHDVPIDYAKLASAIGESSLATDIAEHIDTDALAQSLVDGLDTYDIANKVDAGEIASEIDFSALADEFNTSEMAKEIVTEIDYNRIIAALRNQPVVSDHVPAFNAKDLIARVAKLEETLTRMSGVLNEER